MNEIETRQFWGKSDFNEINHGNNGKPISISHYEPDKSEIRFLIKTNEPKVTITEIPNK